MTSVIGRARALSRPTNQLSDMRRASCTMTVSSRRPRKYVQKDAIPISVNQKELKNERNTQIDVNHRPSIIATSNPMTPNATTTIFKVFGRSTSGMGRMMSDWHFPDGFRFFSVFLHAELARAVVEDKVLADRGTVITTTASKVPEGKPPEIDKDVCAFCFNMASFLMSQFPP